MPNWLPGAARRTPARARRTLQPLAPIVKPRGQHASQTEAAPPSTSSAALRAARRAAQRHAARQQREPATIHKPRPAVRQRLHQRRSRCRCRRTRRGSACHHDRFCEQRTRAAADERRARPAATPGHARPRAAGRRRRGCVGARSGAASARQRVDVFLPARDQAAALGAGAVLGVVVVDELDLLEVGHARVDRACPCSTAAGTAWPRRRTAAPAASAPIRRTSWRPPGCARP